jgi:hypothetical protein
MTLQKMEKEMEKDIFEDRDIWRRS